MRGITVTVAYAAPGVEAIEALVVPMGATVAHAVAASGLPTRLALPATIAYALHGQRATPDTPLVDGDRIEITRPLLVDAKAARHARAARHPLAPAHKVKRSRGGASS